jgi:Acetate kinase
VRRARRPVRRHHGWGFTPAGGPGHGHSLRQPHPGLLLWLNTHAKVPIAEIGDTLEHRSGLLALAGTADMAEILTRTDPAARLAVDVYIHRLCREVAAMTVSLGGLDALVFTGGVGEHAPQIRARTVKGLAYLGLQIAPDRNEDVDGDAVIDAAGSAGGDRAGIPGMRRVLVVTAREDLEIAGGTRHVIGEG